MVKTTMAKRLAEKGGVLVWEAEWQLDANTF